MTIEEAQKFLKYWEKDILGCLNPREEKRLIGKLLASSRLVAMEEQREWWEKNIEAANQQLKQLENQNRMLLESLANREQMKIDVGLKCDFPCEQCHNASIAKIKDDNPKNDV